MNNFHSELPIIKKLTELYSLYYQYLELFPKKDKYALGVKCENYILEVLELLLAAGAGPLTQKQELIQQASIKFDALKVLLRICKNFDLLGSKQYINLQKLIQEIGRMLGGWQKSVN